MKGSGLLAWLLYVAVRVVFAWLQVFPIHMNLRTARWLARVWIFLQPRHRDRAITHLTAAFGTTYTPGQVHALAVRCLENVVMSAVETVCLPRLVNAFTWARYINLVNFNEALELIVAGRGVILVTAHYGSFELTGHLLAALGFDVTAVMRPVDNDYVNRYLVESRRQHGLTLLNKRGATQQAESILQRGAMLAFIGDQDAGRKGCFVDFFGRPASTYKSIALLAMSTQTPIVIGYVRRGSVDARYDLGVERIIRPHEWQECDDPLRWITQTYSSAIESFIRADPGQYWWLHRRWKSQPDQIRRKTRKSAAVDVSPISVTDAHVDRREPSL